MQTTAAQQAIECVYMKTNREEVVTLKQACCTSVLDNNLDNKKYRDITRVPFGYNRILCQSAYLHAPALPAREQVVPSDPSSPKQHH